MTLIELFDEVIENMEEQNLPALIIGLCESACGDKITDSPDERRFVAIMSYLLGEAHFPVRKAVAEEVLELKGLPSDLYLFFACDDIEIAAPFIEPGFPLSEDDLNHLIDFGATDHRLALVARDDLTPEMVHKIMRYNEVNVIRKMNENEEAAVFYEYDDSLSADNDARDALLGEYITETETDTEMENPLDIALKMYSEKSRFADVIELIAKQAELPKETVKNLFSKKEVEPISILCKGLGVGDDAFAALAKFRCRRLGQLERLADQARDAYPEIDTEYAENMLTDLQSQAVAMARAMNG